MSNDEKHRFLSDIQYFWQEKGDIERYVGFSMEKLKEADPVLASAYERLKLSEETFTRLCAGIGSHE